MSAQKAPINANKLMLFNLVVPTFPQLASPIATSIEEENKTVYLFHEEHKLLW